MWFVYLLTLFNALVSHHGFVNIYRVTIGFAYINAIDIGALILFLVAVFANQSGTEPKARTHPMLMVILVCLTVGAVMGFIGAMINQTPMPYVFRHFRDYAPWPVCIFAGYRLMGNSKTAWRWAYVLVLAGIIVATMNLTHFYENAESVSYAGSSINAVRSVNFVGSYAGMGAVLCIFSILYRPVRMMPSALAAIIATYCVLGQFAPLTRGEWVQCIAGVFALVFLLPRGRRFRAFLKSALIAPVIAVAMFFAIQEASNLMHKDFGKMVSDRVWSLLPTARETTTENKAWDTRVGSIGQELQIWMGNPLIGEGFASQRTMVTKGEMEDTGAYGHNGWSSVLATTGIFGFAGYMALTGTMVFVGRRLVLNALNREQIMMGALTFTCGIFTFINVLTSGIWIQRLAIFFGVACGAALRMRDAQVTALENAPYEDQYVHEELDPAHPLAGAL